MKDSLTLYRLDVENLDLTLFKDTIERLGHKLVIYRDPFKMILDLSQSETKPDIIFLGSNMPILDGKEIISILYNSIRLNTIPVILISRALPQKLRNHYTNNGVKHIIRDVLSVNFNNTFKEVLEMKFA